MANAAYPEGLDAILNGDIDLNTDTIKVALVDDSYTYSAAHDFYDDISADVVGTPVALAGVTMTAGVVDATSPTSFSGTGGNDVDTIIIYKDTGVAATSPLLFHLDTVSSGLPFSPPAGAWTLDINWDTGANKIVKFG